MRLIDDIFMRVAFSMCPQSVQVALRIIMDKPDLIVVEVQTQKDLPSILAHSFFLDILAKDANSTYYDIEIQRKDDDAHPRRATTHASATETMLRQKNEKAQHACELVVIFITEHDVLGAGLPIYHIERTIMETGQQFGDGVHIIYVNGEMAGHSTPLERLVHDLLCTNADEMFFPELAHAMHRIKSTPEGVYEMGSLSEKIHREGFAAGEAKGRAEGKAEGELFLVRNMLKKGVLPLDEIAEYGEMSLEEVQKLAVLAH